MAQNKRTKYRVRVRKFLNRDPELPAYIIGIVEDTSAIPNDDPDQSWKWGRIQLDLGDCSRRVCFDFRMETAADRADSLFKIDQITQVVCAVRSAIEKEVRSRDSRQIARKTVPTNNSGL